MVLTDLVVVEAYFALRHHYGVPESEVRAKLKQLLESGVVAARPRGLESAIDGKAPPGLADRLIHHSHGTLDASTLTFDRAQSELEGARPVEEI